MCVLHNNVCIVYIYITHLHAHNTKHNKIKQTQEMYMMNKKATTKRILCDRLFRLLLLRCLNKVLYQNWVGDYIKISMWMRIYIICTRRNILVLCMLCDTKLGYIILAKRQRVDHHQNIQHYIVAMVSLAIT